ncbi:Imidazole glycerol phosphate synthase subunit HisF [Candidatus Anstonella stagnisolia]|nr:Imidazole glycerol phosphate synthase subunit HisF [Candidatus Anstonella stagnisolia]
MQVIPAIDLLRKKCVRLTQGDYTSAKEYSDSPAETAREFVSQGAKLVHVVDLEGAKNGNLTNFDILDQLSYICLMQIGGGIRTIESVNKILSLAATPIISSAAVNDEKFLSSLKPFAKKIAIAIDARDGKISTNGWLKDTGIDAYEFAKTAQPFCSRIIFTSIARDGMLEGPDTDAIKQMRKTVSKKLFISGGISSLEDVRAVKKAGADGCIIGKALYTGKISLKEAIEAGR